MTRRISLLPAPDPDTNDARDPSILVTSRRLAPYVLKALLEAQLAGRRCHLEDLVELLPVRRADIRRTLSALHQNDLLDVMTCRLTLQGFAVAMTVARDCKQPVRKAMEHQGDSEAEMLSLPPPSGERVASAG